LHVIVAVDVVLRVGALVLGVTAAAARRHRRRPPPPPPPAARRHRRPHHRRSSSSVVVLLLVLHRILVADIAVDIGRRLCFVWWRVCGAVVVGTRTLAGARRFRCRRRAALHQQPCAAW
jgi:hypothetical protein